MKVLLVGNKGCIGKESKEDTEVVETKQRFVLNLRAGELVRVKSKEEILATLDEQGTLNRLPFMPEMLQYCGREFKVFKRADKTCDTIEKTGGRRMMNAVHLDLRCDGSSHGGCQARCLLFWKEAWLRRADGGGGANLAAERQWNINESPTAMLSEKHLFPLAQRRTAGEGDGDEFYVCQATELRKATTALPGWELGQYVRDMTSGNVMVKEVISAIAFRSFQHLLKLRGLRFWIGLYDWFQKMRRGVPYPYKQGRLTKKTPSVKLDLKPGELVQVRTHEEILNTLDKNNKNRGLWFDVEMVAHCGKTARVLSRVEKIINDRTGKLEKLPNDCLILEGVYCEAHYSPGRLFCPRSIYSYWREAWLTRIE